MTAGSSVVLERLERLSSRKTFLWKVKLQPDFASLCCGMKTRRLGG